MKLVIDLNSIVIATLMVGSDPDAYPPEDGSKDVNTAEYGFKNFKTSLMKMLYEFNIKPFEVIGVFDARRSRKRRQKIYKGYKAHRPPKSPEGLEEINNAMEMAQNFIKRLGGIIVSGKGSEADDVIAHIAPKLDCVIWTKDKDQLSIDVPTVLMGSGVYLSPSCDDKFLGIERRFVRLHRTLLNDAGDFGPGMGAKGFGEKAFIKMMIAFEEEGMEQLMEYIANRDLDLIDEEDLAAVPELQKILDSAEKVYTTWDLAGWLPINDYDLKWDAGFAQEKVDDIDFEEWYGQQTLITKDNFDAHLSNILLQAEEAPYVSIDIETDVPEESLAWLKEIATNMSRPPIRVDVLESMLCGLSITVGDNMQHTYYFSVDHADTNNLDTESVKDVVVKIGELGKLLVAHNASGFEIPVLYKNWEIWLPETVDNAIASSYVDENRFSHALKNLSMDTFGYGQQSYQEVTQGRGMSELTGKEVLSYGCDDTIMTSFQFNLFQTIMIIEGSYDAFRDVETWCQYMVAHSFVNGTDCDLDVLAQLKKDDAERHAKAEAIINKYLIDIEWPGSEFEPLEELSAAEIKRGFLSLTQQKLKTSFRKIEKLVAAIKEEGQPEYAEWVAKENLDDVNQYLSEQFVPNPKLKVNSPKQIAALLYEYLAYPVRYRNKVTDKQKELGQHQGNPSTGEDAIEWARHADACEDGKKLLKAVLDCKACMTRDSLYYTPYPHLVHWRDGKLHPSLRQSATSSRRFAPSGPNVNQIPKRSKEGKKIRRCVVPHSPTAKIVSPDISGQELRLGADESRDPAFLSCYVGDNLKDLHTITGFAICQKQGNEYNTYDEFHKAVEMEEKKATEYRDNKGKQTNFLGQYDGSSFTLAMKLRVPEDECQEFLDAKAAAFPAMEEWKDSYREKCRDRKYATTKLGARKHIHKIIYLSGEDHVLRSALNFRIQSSAAEMTKLIMGSVWRSGILDRYDAIFYFPVHDELCFSVEEEDLDGFCRELEPIMTQTYADMTVPIVSSLSIGDNFGEIKEYPWPTEDAPLVLAA